MLIPLAILMVTTGLPDGGPGHRVAALTRHDGASASEAAHPAAQDVVR